MLKKIGALARALYILLAIVAAFVALTMMNVPLVLVVLGLIAGLAVPRDRMVLLAAIVIALPIVVPRPVVNTTTVAPAATRPGVDS